MKRFIQICSFLSLLILFSAVSAQAQSVNRFEGQIPFDFNIGQKSYKAGSYVIKIRKDSVRNTTLTLEDNKGNVLHTALVLENGSTSETNPELVFNRYENQRFLSKIATTKSAFSIAMSNSEKQIAKQNREKSSETQIATLKPKR